MNIKPQSRLVSASTSDRLGLSGFYAPADGTKVILYIHGYASNFYEHPFIMPTADAAHGAGATWLSANTRGAGMEQEIISTESRWVRTGANFERLEDAHLDIDAWITFLASQGKTDIILAGHSIGAMKVVRYLFEGAHRTAVKKLLLLAPFDKRATFALQTGGKLQIEDKIKEAEEMVASGKGDEYTDPATFGIHVSYKTFVSYHKRDDLGRIFEFCTPTYDFPILRKIMIPTKVIVGSNDPVFHPSHMGHPDEAMLLLTTHIPHATGVIIPGADHGFLQNAADVAREVALFV